MVGECSTWPTRLKPRDSVSMSTHLLVTFEILAVIVGPLLFLYLRGKWPVGSTLPSLLALPLLWYLTYAPIHELSHVAGTYLMGGKVVAMKLIPRFWRGEFGQAWITPEGLSSTLQISVMMASPYLLDAACLIAGHFWLRRKPFEGPFVEGLLLMLLCLRPAFDFACETIAFARGHHGDLFHLAEAVGNPTLWALVGLCLGLSVFVLSSVLRHATGARGSRTSPAA